MSLIAYWSFDEGTGNILRDSSENRNDGVIYGDPIWVEGIKGKALKFDGVDDYIEISAPAGGIFDPETITVATWIKVNGTNSDIQRILQRQGQWGLYVNADGNIVEFFISTRQDGGVWKGITAPINLEQWYFVAGTYDGNEMRLYLNGELVASAPQSGKINTGQGVFYIGSSGTVQFFNGIIDEVRIYDRALSEEEIKALYESYFYSPDYRKVILIEIKTGVEIEGFSWTATGGGSYYTDFKSTEYGEVLEVVENGNSYTRVGSISECDSSASTFFYDYDHGKLYIHTSGGDSPDVQVSGEYKYIIIAKFKVCLTNRQSDEARVVYTPEGAFHEVYYLPYLSGSSLPAITQSVGDYYLANITMNFGTLSFVNTAWWYKVLEEWLWQNAEVRVLIGEVGNAYEDFELVFKGIVRNPKIDNGKVVFETKDVRLTELGPIPVERFSKDVYPNLEDNADGSPIPVPFGQLKGITPVCIDTTTYTYKVSAYPIEAIEAVYVDGKSVSFTADLVNGEFTLAEAPGDGHVTCDIKGVKCDMTTGEYSENVADILYFVLNALNGVPAERIDTASFQDLKAARTQKVAWYLNTEMKTIDFVRVLEATGVFHLIPGADGVYKVKYYVYGSGAATPVRKEDIRALQIKYDADRIFKSVLIKYNKNFSTGEWRKVVVSDEKVKYKYNDEDMLIVETALWDKPEAESLGNFYLKLVKRAGKFISLKSSKLLFSLEPGDKISVSKEIYDEGLKEISVLNEEVYRVLSLKKRLNTGTVEVTALRDIEATGAEHSDVAHVDTHTDVPHEDVAHSDVAHSDSYTDTHYDTHADVAHSDVAHDDSHVDYYSDHADDPLHSDKHDDTHSDVAHSDVAHSDEHTDWYTDSHDDAGHGDVAHEDVPHDDTHGDVPHADSQY